MSQLYGQMVLRHRVRRLPPILVRRLWRKRQSSKRRRVFDVLQMVQSLFGRSLMEKRNARPSACRRPESLFAICQRCAARATKTAECSTMTNTFESACRLSTVVVWEMRTDSRTGSSVTSAASKLRFRVSFAVHPRPTPLMSVLTNLFPCRCLPAANQAGDL